MKQSRKRCLIIFLVIIVILGTAGALVYVFVPDVINKVPIPGLNRTNAGSSDGQETDTPGPPTPAPTTTPLFDYDFIQCAKDSSDCCNGLEEICDLGVDEILYAASHNAMATREGGFPFGYNHLYDLEESLSAGYRAISLDLCFCGGEFQLCHGICHIAPRSPTTVFENILSFLNDHESEIIMINLQVNSNAQGGGQVSLPNFANLLSTQVEGFDDMLYNHDVSQPWPTLRTLQDLRKRLLLFHFNGPSCGDIVCPDGFHYWFDFASETAFNFGSSSALADVATSCAITRGGASRKDFLAVTTFVTPPNQEESTILNAASFLESRIDACSQQNEDRNVNLVYVDFWSVGDLPRVVQTHNKALAAARRRKMLRA